MTDHRQAAVDAAREAITRSLAEDYWLESDPDDLLARKAVDAAAPHLAAAERERIAALAEAVDAFYDAPCPSGLPDCVHQDTSFAGLIRTEGDTDHA